MVPRSLFPLLPYSSRNRLSSEVFIHPLRDRHIAFLRNHNRLLFPISSPPSALGSVASCARLPFQIRLLRDLFGSSPFLLTLGRRSLLSGWCVESPFSQLFPRFAHSKGDLKRESPPCRSHSPFSIPVVFFPLFPSLYAPIFDLSFASCHSQTCGFRRLGDFIDAGQVLSPDRLPTRSPSWEFSLLSGFKDPVESWHDCG